MIRHAPSQLFFHNLILMNLLEHGYYVILHGCLKNEEMKSYTLQIRRTVAIHITKLET